MNAYHTTSLPSTWISSKADENLSGARSPGVSRGSNHVISIRISTSAESWAEDPGCREHSGFAFASEEGNTKPEETSLMLLLTKTLEISAVMWNETSR
jgi:hypothetical protein